MRGAWEIYRDNFIHVGGSSAICEGCDNAYPCKSYYLNKHAGENCGGEQWIDFSHRLSLLYPDQEKYVSEIEGTLYNVTLANQDASGDIRYHTNLAGTKDRATHNRPAAKSTTRWLLARLPEFIYTLANDGLYVNMHSASSITWNKDGSKVTLNTSAQFPGDTNVSMRVLVENPLPLKIRLRLLSWASGGVTVLVNGQNAALGMPGTFVTLDRTWSKNDTIAFNIPVGFLLIKYTGFDRDAHYHRYALKYGPLLMRLSAGPL